LFLGALALLGATSANAEPYYPFNAADFTVPADELDAVSVGQAAVHAGFFPVSENDPKLRAMREAPDKTYEIWELSSHKVATIVLTRMKSTGQFVVTFTAKDPSRNGASLSGDACRRWLRFSAAMRMEFRGRLNRFKFRFPQCEP
jgi:hypothetical protein